MKFSLNKARYCSTKKIDDILPDIIETHRFDGYFVLDELRNKWSQLTGDIISTHSKPEKVMGTLLIVAADHSVYSNEIMMMKQMIINEISRQFGREVIKEIKVIQKRITW